MDAAGHSRRIGPRGDSAGATESGADVNKAMDDGSMPLVIAAYKDHETVVRALMELGADISMATVNGATPLYFTAKKGQEAIV